MKNPLRDLSLYALFISNVFVAVWAVATDKNYLDLVWVYYIQTLIIWVYLLIRLANADKFSKSNLPQNGPFKVSTGFVKFQSIVFFILFYGLFLSGQFVFLSINTVLALTKGDSAGIFADLYEGVEASQPLAMGFICISIFVFFINHTFSFIFTQPKPNEVVNAHMLVLSPLARIFPIQLIAIGASQIEAPLVTFLILKTAADLFGHIFTRNIYQVENSPDNPIA